MTRKAKPKPKPDFRHELKLRKEGNHNILGIDEAGMSPLAGPVTAAGVIFLENPYIKGLNDSKLLSPEKREDLYEQIINKAYKYQVISIGVNDINNLNIFNASQKAMRTIIYTLYGYYNAILVDGNKKIKHLMPPYDLIPQFPLVKGDQRSISIAAASILAKVTRDRYMCKLAEKYPWYGWQQNKGYPTAMHKEAIRKYGTTEHHRVGFKGVREYIGKLYKTSRR